MRKIRTSLILGLAALIFAPTLAQATNQGDFAGGVAIGSSYAGVDAAPSNGLIIQGEVGIGNSSPSAPLDVGMAGTTTGAIVLEGGSSGYVQIQPAGVAGTWTLTLPPNAGSNGYVLSTDGTGVTSWVANGGGGSAASFGFGGRLTGTSGSPVITSDATAVTTLYYAPYKNCYVPIYNGTNLQYYEFCTSSSDTTGLSLALDDNTGHTGYQEAGDVYDVFVGLNSSTVELCTGPAWSSTTSRGTGSGTTQIAMYDGIWTNANSMTCRYGNASGGTFTCSTNECSYVGSIYIPTLNASSALASTITAGTTSISLTFKPQGAGLGEAYYALLDTTTPEVVLVTGGFGSTSLTVTRGERGTTAATHNSGATLTVDSGQTSFQPLPATTTGGTSPLAGIYNAYNKVPFTFTDKVGA